MKHLICKLFNHKLERNTKDYSSVNEYTCIRCKEKFTTNGYGKIVKLDSFWEQNNHLFKEYSQKKPS